jgi:hypothetical protein
MLLLHRNAFSMRTALKVHVCICDTYLVRNTSLILLSLSHGWCLQFWSSMGCIFYVPLVVVLSLSYLWFDTIPNFLYWHFIFLSTSTNLFINSIWPFPISSRFFNSHILKFLFVMRSINVSWPVPWTMRFETSHCLNEFICVAVWFGRVVLSFIIWGCEQIKFT